MSSLPQSTQALSSTSSSYSAKGSFGPVFIVLAVIAVLAVLACVAGRLCARFMSSDPKPNGGRQRKYHHHHHPRAVKDDIEAAGVEYRIPATLNPAAVIKGGNKRESSQTAAEDSWTKGSSAGGKNTGASSAPGSSAKEKPGA